MGFFGGKSGKHVLGVIGDAFQGANGQQGSYATRRARMQQEEHDRNKPRVVQNNAGDWIEIDPASGAQRVLYKDTPKPDIPELAKTVGYYRSIGRDDIADDLENKARMVTTQQSDPSGEVRTIYSRPTSLMGTAQPAAPAPQPGAVEDGYLFKGGDPADPSSWAPATGGASSFGGSRPFSGRFPQR